METKQEQKDKMKLLNEISRAYHRGDKLSAENKRLKKLLRKAYTAAQILAAAEEGELCMIDARYIVEILERNKTTNKKED